MSHAAVLVVTNTDVEIEIELAMMPFHEFESTGIDKYIQELDITDKVWKQYEDATTTRLEAPDGTLYDPYEDQFFREFTDEEKRQNPMCMGTGSFADGTIYVSKDWGDRLAYRAKARTIPEGWKEIEVPQNKIQTFLEYATSYHGYNPLRSGETPDLEDKDKHKYGWVEIDENDYVVKIIRRTNPRSKWDWYSIGGRWSGILDPEYDPHLDPDNFETCGLCAGSGRRDPPVMTMMKISNEISALINGLNSNLTEINAAEKFEEIKQKHGVDRDTKMHCNGCDGNGTCLKWPTHWAQRGNKARWGDLDIAALTAKKASDLGRHWDEAEGKYHERRAKHHPDESRSFGEAMREYDGIIADLRGAYTLNPDDRQPLWQKIENHPRAAYFRSLIGDAEWRYGIRGVYTREDHVALAPRHVFPVHAILKDGEWIENGQLGWFGVVIGEQEDGEQTIQSVLDSIQSYKWVTVVDYHI